MRGWESFPDLPYQDVSHTVRTVQLSNSLGVVPVLLVDVHENSLFWLPCGRELLFCLQKLALEGERGREGRREGGREGEREGGGEGGRERGGNVGEGGEGGVGQFFYFILQVESFLEVDLGNLTLEGHLGYAEGKVK